MRTHVGVADEQEELHFFVLAFRASSASGSVLDFQTRPGLQQRTVHGEVPVRQQIPRLRFGQNFVEKRLGLIARQQSIRFFVNTVSTHTGSSMFKPTNQRNNRL